MELVEDIVIVGAGLTGLTASLGLHRLGIKSLVLESSAELRVTGFGIGLWTNAWKVLDALGIGDSLRSKHVLIDGIVATSRVTGQARQWSIKAKGKHGEHEVRCIKRRTLLEALANELPLDAIRFSSKVVSIEESGYFKLVHLADGTIIKTKVLIGCDGVNSVVGKWLGFKKPTLTGRVAIRGMANFKGGHGFGPKFQRFFGNGLRSGLVPCDATSIYWFFTWIPSNPEEMTLDNPEKIKDMVLSKLGNTVDHYVKAVVEATELDSVDSASLGYRHPWELLWGNISEGNVCVGGDALHPMTPDLGQGGCCALEDGLVLARCVAEALSKKSMSVETTKIYKEREDYERIEIGLKKYVQERRWRCIDVVATSYLVGFTQQSDTKVLSFLREKLMVKFLGNLLFKIADFDCGTQYLIFYGAKELCI